MEPCARGQQWRAVVADQPGRDHGRHALAPRLLSGLHTCRAIDILTIDRHPLASVGSLLLGLRCSWCGAFPANHRVACVAAGSAAANPARRSEERGAPLNGEDTMPVEFMANEQ
jgi:hypothetical protein